jgi:hypothetical protein
MESRLALMKAALSAEKDKLSDSVQQDGSRWRSGAATAGSLTGYANDIQSRGRRKKRDGDKGGGGGADVTGPAAGRSKFVSKNFSNRSAVAPKGGAVSSTSDGGGASAGGRGDATPRGGRENAEQWSKGDVRLWAYWTSADCA